MNKRVCKAGFSIPVRQLVIGLVAAFVWMPVSGPADTRAATDSDTAPRVVLETDAGDIEIEVYIEKAPLSSADFLAYVDSGLLNGAAFYRTVRPDNDNGEPVISVIQGGIVDQRKRVRPIPHESTADSGILHTDGVISLARAGPGTASGGTFFISIGDQPGLDFGGMRNRDGLGFAAFGRVVRGMDIVRSIHGMEANGPIENAYLKGQMLTRFVAIRKAYRKSVD